MADDAADDTSGAANAAPDDDAPDDSDASQQGAPHADEPSEQGAPHADEPSADAPPPPPTRTLSAPWLWLAFLAPSAVIALGLGFIMKAGPPRGALPPTASAALPAIEASAAPVAASADSVPALEKSAPAEPPFDEEGNGEEPTPPAKRAAPKHFATVQLAALGSCSTESVDGLSRQIIEQARCLEPNAFVPLPKRANLVLTPHVFGYLERGARDHLVRVLEAHSSATLTINSAFRTVAQQYLVWRWAAGKTCGVQLATRPGESNHEIGVALDVAEAGKWRPALEAEQFHWLGSSDRVHFDYKGAGTPPHSTLDVLAFQKLWNKNHRSDAIAESGQYDAATEQRLKKAPADGFTLGASCSAARKR